MMYDSYLIYINSNLLRREICSEHVQRKQSHGQIGQFVLTKFRSTKKRGICDAGKKEPGFESE